MGKKLVLVSQRQTRGPHGDPRDALENNYVEYLERHGISALPISNAIKELDGFLNGVPQYDGIVLTGGNDVSPSEYGEDAVTTLDVSLSRDRTERALLDLAVRRKIPVLGICRGMQFINVYFGGCLVQDMKRQLGQEGHPPDTKHTVEIVDENARSYLEQSSIETNSFHDQVIVEEGLAPPLRPFALERRAGIVEGFYHPAYPIAGVQFHPERPPDDPAAARLMAAFRDHKLYWKEI